MAVPEPRAELGLRPGYHSPQVEARVRLNTNESPYPPPPRLVAELAAAASTVEYHRYPDRHADRLRQAVAEFHGVAPEQVFCANGSNEVIQALCLAYGGPARRAVTFEPTYALHSHIAHVTGTEVVSAGRGGDLTVDPGAARRLLGEAAPHLVFLCSPNNPTGLCEEPATVAAVAEAAPGLVVIDEAYGQFAGWSAMGMVGDDVPLVVTRTFSKTWALAALRLGYAVAPAAVVAALERVILPYHLDALQQVAGVLTMGYVGEMEERVQAIVGERQRILAALDALGVSAWPSQANFVLFDVARAGGRAVWQALLERGVLVRDTSGWPGLEGSLRVTVGTPAENDDFLSALGRVLA
jgi:histidinol-phosphate aminotransferase